MTLKGRQLRNRLNGMAGLLAAACAFVTSSAALAGIANKYTFNDGTARDSVGFQDGTVVDNTGISFFAGGAIDLTANGTGGTVAGSNQDFSLPTTVGAYVDLPNNVFRNAVLAGMPGQVSLEIWFTVQENRNWAEVYAFGRSDMGENFATGAANSDYVALIPRSGVATPDFRGTTHAPGVETPLIGSPTPLPTNVKHHVVMTIDLLDTSGGANPNGTARLYLNNGPAVVGANRPLLDQIDDVNNWLGRSQWPDPLFDGSIDEFRIYDHAMSASEVAASFTTGPDPSPTPTLVIDRSTGAMSIVNQSNQPIQLKGYSINSAGGALNPPTWTSIDADNTFDPNGTWTKQTMTNLQLTESVTGGVLDGGTLPVGGPARGIGQPWRRSPTEDVTFSYTLGDNTTGFGAVQYVGNGGAPFGRSDFNADGVVSVGDWSLFLTNAFTNFPAETAVGAYLKGDLDGDKDNDYQDFLIFKADYIAANGAAAFAALGGYVPEPGAAALAASAALAIAAGRRRRRS